MTDSDEEEYCAECGDPEFDEDGKETHLDEDEYDHDFVYEEDEEEGITLDDIKDGLDVLDKGIDVYNKLKKAGQSPSMDLSADRFTRNIPPRPERPDMETYKLPKIEPAPHPLEVKEKALKRIEKKMDREKKTAKKRWIIGLAIGGVIAIILAIVL